MRRDPAQRLDTVERALSRLRVLIAAGVMVPLVVRGSSGDGGDRMVAIVIGLALVLVNLLVHRRPRKAVLAAASSLAQLVADSAATLLVVTQLDLLDKEVVWALLVIPVLEGALRFRMRGALLTWIGVTLAYVGLELSVPADFSDPATQSAFLEQLETLMYRSGIVLLVAVPGGYLSEQLLRAIGAQQDEHDVAARRGAMLVGVVEAGRRLSELDADYRDTLARAAVELGFDVADCVEVERGRQLTVDTRKHVSGADVELADLAVVRLTTDEAVAARTAMVAGGVDEHDSHRRELADAGLETVVACPVLGAGGVTSVLRAATALGRTPSQDQIECLELLSGQASAALDNRGLVGQLEHARGRMEHQANHDPLTGLPNRLFFSNRLRAEIDALDGARSLCVLFLDLDRFKEVNDTMGHEAGDELLVAVAGRLRNAVRRTDTVARLGGDEFCLILPDTTESQAVTVAEHVSERLDQPFRIADETISVSASIGIVSTSESIDPAELLRRVDTAMYRAKARGRATWQTHSDELDREGRRRAQLQRELGRAIREQDLTAVFQPIASLPDGRIEGVELLARWDSAELGTVPPDVFIEVAERSGMILELGQQMLEEGCRRGAELAHLISDTRLTVAVNISPHQARRDDYAAKVLDTLHRADFDPRRLVLELTERVLVADEVLGNLEVLRGHGIHIAIDDFGRGHTSIGSLDRLPADTLKIDRQFVCDARDDAGRAAIVASMVRLGHDLGMRVVAEGVETPEDLERVRALGCDAAQGYLIGRPVPFADLDLGARPDRRLSEVIG